NFYSENSLGKNSINFPFNKLNITEFCLYWFIAFPVLLSVILLIIFIIIDIVLFLLVNWNCFGIFENANFDMVFILLLECLTGFFLFKHLHKFGFNFDNFGIFKPKSINIKLILFIVVFNYLFAWNCHSFNFYSLSLIVPDYVFEKLINKSEFTNTIGILSFSFSTIVFIPLLEELVFRGIILQKWAIKWGIKAGILTSSLLFAICHLNLNIVPLFILGTIYCVLYFKTGKLIVPIICHSLHNTIVTISMIGQYYSISNGEFISINDYQASMEPLLGQKAIVAAISFAVIMVFLYRNFPKQDDILPYYRNPK
ncbi:CPBP family intramembrane glutamic endopeptidase, partial [Moorena sp. SIO4A1]|uniref:CPBP family intramembrane glutamic endopeptidase n=1 Tax=Moorena sp. SIO4A1 TaxID=2607835 RepID=UPI0025ED1339